jgi:small-conductance mechanosensitive channel
MDLLAAHPRLREVLISALILGLSYFAARALSFLFGRLLTRASQRTTSAIDDRLVVALKRPLTYVLFLAGAFVAVERLPIPGRWEQRIDSTLYVLGVLLITLALARVSRILLQWYTTTQSQAAGNGLAAEFGPLANKLATLFIVLLAAITVLQHLGVNVSSLVVSLGVGSLAVGLAAQDTLSNMFAGFTLLLDRPFRIGDRIQLATGESGDVEAIGMRATRIKTGDEAVLIVPNSLLVKERVVNLTRPTRHITTRLNVGVAYGTDLGAAKRLLIESALASSFVDPALPPLALVTQFGDFAVSLRLVFWARDYAQQGLALDDVHEQVYKRFRQAGIEIPLPVRRVLYESGPKAPPGAEV